MKGVTYQEEVSMKKAVIGFMFILSSMFLIPFGIAGAASVQKIVIDPGHGGKDSGASQHGLKEKDLTLAISRKINANLQNYYHVQTKMTRNSDVYVSLPERTNIANQWGADFFLSIHINSGGGSGYEDYVYTIATSKDRRAQQEINAEVNKVLQTYKKVNRGKKSANFHVLRESRMSAALIEILFIDNISDANLLQREQFQNDIARAITQGLTKALHIPERNSGTSMIRKETTTHSKIIPPVTKPVTEKKTTAKVTKASGTYVVTAHALTVRAGNGLSYAPVGYLHKDDQIEITGKTGNGWYEIIHKGKPAYVSGYYVTPKKSTTKPTVTATPKAQPKTVTSPAPKSSQPKADSVSVTKVEGGYTVMPFALTIRAGSGSHYAPIGYLAKDDIVEVTGKTNNNWYEINHRTKKGYVYGAYVKENTSRTHQRSNTPKTSTQTKTAKGTHQNIAHIVTASSLHVRAEDTRSAAVIGYLQHGDTVNVVGKTKNNWYKFTYKGRVGYVDSNYLKKR